MDINNNRIIKIDLSNKRVEVEIKDEKFLRTYIGGSTLGAYYLLTETEPQIDPLSSDNVLIFTGSIVSGVPLSGFTRTEVIAKSPLTGGIGVSQLGGDFAYRLKKAGYIGIVIKGKADHPVYIWIEDDKIDIMDAENYWGMDTLEAENEIKKDLRNSQASAMVIGPAGEKKVKFATIMSKGNFAAGRTGLGAVMGSKNLKAVLVSGTKKIDIVNPEYIRSLAQKIKSRIADSPLEPISEMGSSVAINWTNVTGGLPTYNFKHGFYNNAEKISGEHIYETIHTKTRDNCWACVVKCKQRISFKDDKYEVSADYGCPEYETLAMLGSNLGIDDLKAIAKANELCNRYGIDTITTGAIIATIMEAYQEGIVNKAKLDGIEVVFGNANALLTLIHKIANREGVGDILAEGPRFVINKFNIPREKSIDVKGSPVPAHEPRIKKSLALTYSVVPIGADHVCTGHDTYLTPETHQILRNSMKAIGLLEDLVPYRLNSKTVRFVYYSQVLFALLDSLSICIRVWEYLIKSIEVPECVNAITGWETSLWELMKVGERSINLQRIYNFREGLDSKDDTLPERFFKALENEKDNTNIISQKDWEECKQLYYAMAGWDDTGFPRDAKLLELDMEWVIND